MPNTINPLTIATNIADPAKVSVSVTINGTPTALQIYDLTDFPEAPDGAYCPMMFPKLDFITDTQAEPDALATGLSRPWNITYNLNYRILYAVVSQQITIANMLAPMTDLWGQIYTAILQSDVAIGSEDVRPLEAFNMGVVNAPNETAFFGFDMKVQIMEFLQ